MKEYREAWNRHTEARDWEWWLGKVEGMSNAELQQEIAECKAETDAIRKKASPPQQPSSQRRCSAVKAIPTRQARRYRTTAHSTIRVADGGRCSSLAT